jgi:hypothetical protein
MPAFSYLTEQERRDLVQVVKSLTARTDTAGRRTNLFEAAVASGAAARPVEVPPEPPITVQELTLGRDVYRKMACATCHGETGAAAGAHAQGRAGLPVRPRGFNTRLFRAAHGRDLYLRINGLAAPMIHTAGNPETGGTGPRPYMQSLRRTDVAVNDLLIPEIKPFA